MPQKSAEARREYQRRWRAANRGYHARWRQTHREGERARKARWRRENPVAARASDRRWRERRGPVAAGPLPLPWSEPELAWLRDMVAKFVPVSATQEKPEWFYDCLGEAALAELEGRSVVVAVTNFLRRETEWHFRTTTWTSEHEETIGG